MEFALEASKFFVGRGTKARAPRNPCGRLIPLPLSTGHTGRSCGDAGCALFLFVISSLTRSPGKSVTRKNRADPSQDRPISRRATASRDDTFQEAAARGVRILEFRWKNSA